MLMHLSQKKKEVKTSNPVMKLFYFIFIFAIGQDFADSLYWGFLLTLITP